MAAALVFYAAAREARRPHPWGLEESYAKRLFKHLGLVLGCSLAAALLCGVVLFLFVVVMGDYVVSTRWPWTLAAVAPVALLAAPMLVAYPVLRVMGAGHDPMALACVVVPAFWGAGAYVFLRWWMRRGNAAVAAK